MNIDQIRELAEIVNQNGLTELVIDEGNLHIRMGKELRAADAPIAYAAPVAISAVPAVEVAPTAINDDKGVDFNRAIEVKANLIGVFYAAPSPDAEPYIRIGSKVQKGDVLCIIEAMKRMNEIVAEQSGEVVDICVQNGDVVEFGQTLFKLC